MAKVPINSDTDFTVSDDKILVNVMAFLFFAIFLYALFDAIRKEFADMDFLSYAFILLLIPATIFFLKGRRKRIYIRINKSGIYQGTELVTTWPNFLNAYITQKEKVLSIQDNFILIIEYLGKETDKGYRRKIPLTNTQNKSEEEIMNVIAFFHKIT